MAERAQARPIVGSHLDLVVGPDDEVLQEQVGHIWTGDVLELVVHWQSSQTVPNKAKIIQGLLQTDTWVQGCCSAADVLLGGDKAPAKPPFHNKDGVRQLQGKHLLFHLDVMNKKPDKNPN